MIDTLCLFGTLSGDEYASLRSRLTSVRPRPNGPLSGELDGMRVMIRGRREYTATMSIPKMVVGSNAADLSIADLVAFVEGRILADPIFGRSQVTRLDTAGLLYLRGQPTRYLRCLGPKPRWRHATDYHAIGERYDEQVDELTSRTYRTLEQSLVLYDKARQLEDETRCVTVVDPDDELSGRFLLKVELQIKRHVGHHVLGGEGRIFYPRDLVDPAVLLTLAGRWRDEYRSISKVRPVVLLGSARTTKEFQAQLMRAGLAALGAESVDAALREVGMYDANQRRRCKDLRTKLRLLGAEGGEAGDPVEELDAEVERVFCSYVEQIEAVARSRGAATKG